MSTKAKKTGFWNMLDRLEGDKIIWMIVFFLIIFSILAVSSSTSLLAIQQKSSRLSFAMEQILMAAVGLGIIAGLCKIGKIGIFRFFSQGLFVLSFLLLAFLASHFTKIPFSGPCVSTRPGGASASSDSSCMSSNSSKYSWSCT